MNLNEDERTLVQDCRRYCKNNVDLPSAKVLIFVFAYGTLVPLGIITLIICLQNGITWDFFSITSSILPLSLLTLFLVQTTNLCKRQERLCKLVVKLAEDGEKQTYPQNNTPPT
jgi:hypothetical protein